MTSQVLKRPASSTLESTETPTLADELRAVGVEPYDEAAVEAYKAEKVQEHSRIFLRKPDLFANKFGLTVAGWLLTVAYSLLSTTPMQHRGIGIVYAFGLGLAGFAIAEWRQDRKIANMASRAEWTFTIVGLIVTATAGLAIVGPSALFGGLLGGIALIASIIGAMWLLSGIRRTRASWQIVYLQNHNEKIPSEVIGLGFFIKDNVPNTHLSVDEMRNDENALLDPFLVVDRYDPDNGFEQCWVKGWDDNGVFDL